MRRMAAVLTVALLACSGGDNSTGPEPTPALDTFTLSGTWDLTGVNGTGLPAPTGDTATCEDGAGGRDTVPEEWRGGNMEFGPDSVDLRLLSGYECGGITTTTTIHPSGAYVAREDSVFFDWSTRFPSFRAAEWALGRSAFETVGGFRFDER